jgi:hypothetical protein
VTALISLLVDVSLAAVDDLNRWSCETDLRQNCFAGRKSDADPFGRTPHRGARPLQFRRWNAQTELVGNTSLTRYLQEGPGVRKVTQHAAVGPSGEFDDCGFEDAPPAYFAIFHVRLRRTDEKFLKLVAESPALVLASMQGSGNHANDDVGQRMWNLGPLVNVLSLNTVISSA